MSKCTCDLMPSFSVSENGMGRDDGEVVYFVQDSDGEAICEAYCRAYGDLIAAALNKCSGSSACVMHVEMFKE
jgi:hypothetical protein